MLNWLWYVIVLKSPVSIKTSPKTVCILDTFWKLNPNKSDNLKIVFSAISISLSTIGNFLAIVKLATVSFPLLSV